VRALLATADPAAPVALDEAAEPPARCPTTVSATDIQLRADGYDLAIQVVIARPAT